MVEYVEASSNARKVCFAGALALVLAGVSLWLFAKALPQPAGDPPIILQTIADRALVAAIMATIFHLPVVALVVWLAGRAVSSGQWPPVGVPMPYRERVRRINRPSLVWLAVALLVGLKALWVVSYWRYYVQLREIAQLVGQ